MILYSIIIFISFQVISAPNCEELGKILQGYEDKLNSFYLNNCKDLSLKALNPNPDMEEKEIFTQYRCSDFKSLEGVIQNLENQRAVLIGFEKLKNDIKQNKQGAQNLEFDEGEKFVKNLSTATSFELLLNTTVANKPLMGHLKENNEKKEDFNLLEEIKKYCKKNEKNLNDACNEALFDPDESVQNEILSLINNAQDLSEEKINNWKEALQIVKNDGTATSFLELNQTLKSAFSAIKEKERFTKEHLKAIALLENFKNPKSDLSFIQDLLQNKSSLKKKALIDRLSLLVGDAQKRQELEVQSRLSLSLYQLKKSYPDLELSGCEDIKTSTKELRRCLTSLEKKLPDLSDDLNLKSTLSEYTIPALHSSVDYMTSLDHHLKSCTEAIKSSEQQDPTLAACSLPNTNLLELGEKIRQLNLLKDKMGQENLDLMSYRNFALKKWKDQNCSSEQSPMDLCESWTNHEGEVFDVTVAQNILKVSQDSMDVVLALAPPDPDESKAKALCEDGSKNKTSTEEKLCAFFNVETRTYTAPTPMDLNEDIDGPVAAPDGKHQNMMVRDSIIQTGASLLGSLLQSQRMRPMPRGISPYPYNYTPMNQGTPPMGVSDSILFNARFHGAYGFYAPTPGLRPGSSFGQYSAPLQGSPPLARYFTF